jgi:RNA polymerase sigma factor (sigma-70 family)
LAFLKHIPTNETDEELVAAYQKTGELKWASQLYQRYMELVYGVCLKYLKIPEDAQDATIALFEEVSTKLSRHEVANFKGWLYTVAKNHCLMRLRSQKKEKTVPFDGALMQSGENEHLNNVLEKEEQFRFMEVCLEQLVPEQRKSIELFYLEGKCYNEIAAATGLEWNKIRSFIQNGRRNLKICMDKQKAASAL